MINPPQDLTLFLTSPIDTQHSHDYLFLPAVLQNFLDTRSRLYTWPVYRYISKRYFFPRKTAIYAHLFKKKICILSTIFQFQTLHFHHPEEMRFSVNIYRLLSTSIQVRIYMPKWRFDTLEARINTHCSPFFYFGSTPLGFLQFIYTICEVDDMFL